MSSAPRILILGASGQLGRELQVGFAGAGEILAAGRDTFDLAAPGQLRNALRDCAPHIILNAAAYTAVDRAESEPGLARSVNAEAPRVLAEEAARSGALLVHYSTDYVFDGSKGSPWTEDDPPRPLNVYGATKLAGEEAIRSVGGRFLIFRTSWVYAPHGGNFLLTMLRLARQRDTLSIVDDQFGAPTTATELARATRAVVDAILADRNAPADNRAGVYHMTCSGSVTWCGFAQAIFARSSQLLDGRIPQVRPIPSADYPTPAQRPRNSVLSNEKLAARFGVRLAPWEAALDAVIARLLDAVPAGSEGR